MKHKSKRKIFKILFLFLLLSVVYQSTEAQDFYYSNDSKIFRTGRDKEFRDPDNSPLTKEEFRLFKGLNYYKVSSKYKVRAKLVQTPNEQQFEAETSNGKPRLLVKYGYLEFSLNKQKQTLNIYQVIVPPDSSEYDEAKSTLFLPFKDLTNNKETYGGGRYLDFKIPNTDEIVVDFNLAYNPSCAYGRKYSCFLVPKANHLKIEIKAGEKLYKFLAEQNRIK